MGIETATKNSQKFRCLYRLFDVTPEVQKMFNKFADVPREQLESNKHYRDHALNVIKTVQRGVKALDDIPALSKVLQNLGKRHVSRGIEALHFDVSIILLCRYHSYCAQVEINNVIIGVQTYHIV